MKRPTASASTAATSSPSPDVWRSASAASCARGVPRDAILVEGPTTTTPRWRRSLLTGERYGRVYQINYLRASSAPVHRGLPTRALTMTNEYEIVDTPRRPHLHQGALSRPCRPACFRSAPMVEGLEERDYYLGSVPSHAHPAGLGRRPRRLPGGVVMTSTGEAILFWILAPVSVAGALGLVFARKAVHAAIGMALTMIILGVFYLAQGADFLGVIQIFVYTGAVMVLFLFVVMLVGVDSSDSIVETLKASARTGVRRWAWALLVGALDGPVGDGPADKLDAINSETATSPGWPS